MSVLDHCKKGKDHLTLAPALHPSLNKKFKLSQICLWFISYYRLPTCLHSFHSSPHHLPLYNTLFKALTLCYFFYNKLFVPGIFFPYLINR